MYVNITYAAVRRHADVTLLAMEDIELVNLVIADIYAIKEPEEFFRKLPVILDNLFPSDLVSYNELGNDRILGT